MERMMSWSLSEKGKFVLKYGEEILLEAHAEASDVRGRKIDTRKASVKQVDCGDGCMVASYEADNGLVLTCHLDLLEGNVPYSWCVLSDRSGQDVESRSLIPLVIQGGDKGHALWKSLWTKMLLVPYDNDMWLRYEAVPFRAGRRSYDLTVVFRENEKGGILIGALDFDTWKNGIVCSAYDAKTLEARCGVADEGTHDTELHGTLIGKEITSSRFCIIYHEDYRAALEQYGDLIAEEYPPMEWEEGVPFGFNSWAGLATGLNEKDFRDTAKFFRETLVPAGYQNDGISYMNMDAWWHPMSTEVLLSMRQDLHDHGQKAGIYDVPFCFFGQDIHAEIPGCPGHTFEEILLKDRYGEILPRVDGGIPMDVTHPVWRQQMEWKAKRYIDWGYDYLKTDFLSHGGMEGMYYDTNVRTGRQALKMGYEFLVGLFAPEKIGRKFFLSLSIAPLFPCGYGHARRFSCDAFGTDEDVEYVLNAQSWCWWQNGKLYTFNDPDHICLEKSFCMDRSSTEGEAKSRYTAAAIAGSVMMLSDDYKRELAKERAIRYAANKKVNEIAASRVAFRPVDFGGTSASKIYQAEINGEKYIAVFHWENEKVMLHIPTQELGIAEENSCLTDLWTDQKFVVANGEFTWEAEGCDCLLLQARRDT